MKYLTIFVILLFGALVQAQTLPYHSPFGVSVQKDVVYGAALNFMGNPEQLRLDIFRPVGDKNAKRPLFIYTHGGGWQEISNKNEAEGIAVCTEFAKRGYVAVNVEYRRGFHRQSSYTPYLWCPLFTGNLQCAMYPYDSSEVFRAIYRGMQDLRGAIRFMKGRHALDSTDVNKVLIGGASAGAFIALYAGYLDCKAEKPLSCGALPPVKAADPDLAFCYNPGPISLQRPDLGGIEGALHLQNGYDASVKGVVDFFGGVSHDLTSGVPGRSQPALYAFHQTNDVVVPCGAKPLLSGISDVINAWNLCQPAVNTPQAAGACAIREAFKTLEWPTEAYQVNIVENGPSNLFANPPGHAIDNVALRVAQADTFLAPFLSGAKTLPVSPLLCKSGLADAEAASERSENAVVWSFDATPTLFGLAGFVLRFDMAQTAVVEWAVYDIRGRRMAGDKAQLADGQQSIAMGDTGDWPVGMYVVVARCGNWRQQRKLMNTKL